MVTAEIAAALPVFVALLIAAVWTVSVATAQARCVDAAREAARAAARGEDDAVVRDVAEAVAPSGATVKVSRSDTEVTVEVKVRAPLPVPFRDIGPTVSGRAVAILEP